MKITERRIPGSVRRITDLALKWLPIGALMLIGAYLAAKQAVSPQHRTIKGAVALALVALMFRFDMVWSIYLFALLYPFPSGIALGSTNTVLMTLIPLIWAVRAASVRARLLRKTPLDAPILLFIFAYVVSLFNVDTTHGLIMCGKFMWVEFAGITWFYMIVTFADDEQKLTRLLQVGCVACALVMLTAVLELAFPGKSLVPGWISLRHVRGMGKLGFRIEGIRTGGAVGSHAVLSDFGTQQILLMAYFTIRSRNPLTRTAWGLLTALTLVAVVSTANRGAFVGLFIGTIYTLYLFRSRLSVLGMFAIFISIAVVYVGVDHFLSEHTIAVSLIGRVLGSDFEGVVPENRTMTWVPALKRSLDHILIGHGAFFDIKSGITKVYWPHNGYIFYLYTIGMLGLGAYFWLQYRLFRLSRAFRAPLVERSHLGALCKLTHVWLVVFSIDQLKTDHQRDDIYPFIMWMCFGACAAAGLIIRDRLARETRSGAGPPGAVPAAGPAGASP